MLGEVDAGIVAVPNAETRTVLPKRESKYPRVAVNEEAVSDTNAIEVVSYGSRRSVGIAGAIRPEPRAHGTSGNGPVG